jgi:hypothetical protein
LQTLSVIYCSNLQGLPELIGQLRSLQTLDVSYCSSLQGLPESIEQLQSLQTLDVSYCSNLQELPESIGDLENLQKLFVSHCHSLVRLPMSMDGMKALTHLDVSRSYGLEVLPRRVPASLKQLDMSHCRQGNRLDELAELAEQLVDVAEQMPDVVVRLYGWDALLGRKQSTSKQLCDLVDKLRLETTVKRLLTDKDTITTSLERLSWLAVLLAATTFTAAIAPPGGYNNGLLFLPYSNADCRGDQSSSSQAYNSVDNCTIPFSKGACPVGAQDISGACIQALDACTDRLGCKAQVRVSILRAFFVLDLLSFGFSMALVLFVVACSMPRKIGVRSARYAGLIWLSLVAASFLMAAAVGCGMGALVAGVLAVYPKEFVADVLVPFGVTITMTACAFWGLVVRWVAMFPGKAAVRDGLSHACQQAVGKRAYRWLADVCNKQAPQQPGRATGSQQPAAGKRAVGWLAAF